VVPATDVDAWQRLYPVPLMMERHSMGTHGYSRGTQGVLKGTQGVLVGVLMGTQGVLVGVLVGVLMGTQGVLTVDRMAAAVATIIAVATRFNAMHRVAPDSQEPGAVSLHSASLQLCARSCNTARRVATRRTRMVATRTLGRARRADTVRILFEWNDDALNGVPLIAEVREWPYLPGCHALPVLVTMYIYINI
jgi:hypothetical protein